MVSSSYSTPIKSESEEDSLPPPMSPTSVAESHIQSYCAQHDDTPSFNAIITAYHREGKGDRELLLALLKAKRAEDERLTARDRLKAEQLAVHSMFHARYMAQLYSHPPYANPYFASTPPHSTSSPSTTDSHSRSRESSYTSASSCTATSPPAMAVDSRPLSKKRGSAAVEEITREDALRALRNKLARQSPPVPPKASKPTRKRTLSPKVNAATGNGGLDILLTAVDQERRAMATAIA